MIWALYSEVFRALGFGYDIIRRKRNSAGLRDIGGLVAAVEDMRGFVYFNDLRHVGRL